MKFDFKNGTEIIKKSLENCPKSPGIYQFYDSKKKILYVGKAKNLFNRVNSYTNFNNLSNRIKKMVGLIISVNFIKTHTEIDALLLESNLIKNFKPPFNIRLIDDKSFPFILITQNHEWPRLEKFRGNQSKKGFYFGPFANVNAVEKVLTILEKGFLLRTCSDSVFSNRKRPCLLYQIKRCSGPCTNQISKKQYSELVDQARTFLNGKDNKIKEMLASKMNLASKKQLYEEAALYRDRIKAISKIYQEQYSFLKSNENFDLICAVKKEDTICVQCFFFRKGRNLGNKEYFFQKLPEKKSQDVLEEFLSIFYYKTNPPDLIIINKKINNLTLIELALKKIMKKKINILLPKKGKKLDLLKMVESNIRLSLNNFIEKNTDSKKLIQQLKNKLCLSSLPERIEVYDNSHLSGTNPVGAMIVYDKFEFNRENYRKFNIKINSNETNDDYFMMKQVLDRRFSFENKKSSWKIKLPNLIIIDGGKGHLNVVKKILDKKNINNIELIAIAKGEQRNAGNEKIFYGDKIFNLSKNDNVLYFLQRLRDEAHRFVISSQRYKRKLNMKNSIFDQIPGIGQKSKKKLLGYFGSIENIKTAGLRDLQNSPGIGKVMANKIYNEFNEKN